MDIWEKVIKSIISIASKGFLLLLLLSCVNTSYSRLDEIAINDELVDIILGQFPHHGAAFYLNEIKTKEPILDETPNDFELRNDVAVAYLKIEAWEKAQEHFGENEKRHPGKYKTHSNLGVMYKKMGQYEKAAFHIKKSLEIKPEGHMGLGDYYLKMIHWKQNYKKEQNTNFLGVPYDNPEQTAVIANKEYVITLIKNDYKFIDAYMVLGDILFEEENYQLAIRAYNRANTLIEDKYGEIAHKAYLKMHTVVDKIAQQKGSRQIVDKLRYSSQLDNEIEAAENWLKEFKRTETELIHQKKVTFDLIRKKMKDKGINKPKVIEAIIYRGYENSPSIKLELFIVFIGLIIISPFIAYYFYVKWKIKNRKKRRPRLKVTHK